ncbi:MAG: response regulator [Cyanobacteria bacterium SZAS TMP-1]|nr:response regulator [Cyanobacteria bacterium SZAS TMP-1]
MAKDLVLIVEDSSLQQQIFASLALKTGVEPHLVSSGQQAIDAYLANPDYFVVFMDVKMTEMSGLECTRRIREIEAKTGKHITIVAITAHTGAEAEAECLAAGMDEYLSKPFSFEQFDSIVQRLLLEKDRKQAQLS